MKFQKMLNNKRTLHIGIHAFIWLVFLSIPILLRISDIGELTGQYLFNYYLNFIMNAFVFYAFYLYFLPKVLAQKKFKRFILYSIVFILSFSLFDRLIVKYINILFYEEKIHEDYFSLSHLFGNTFKVTFFAVFSAFTRFTIDWFKNIYQQEKIKRQNLSSELNMLRLQISPHFLMNSLNNIYSLVLKKSDDAPNALLKLSEIMRYMLYETNTEKKALNIELRYIKNYIDIQLLRLRKESYAKLHIDEIDESKEIAPLLLIPFIENAFKHGDRNMDKDCIFIEIKEEENMLLFYIKNHISKIPLNTDIAGGIGLENVKRRLQLLYPQKHQLKIEKNSDIYSVTLKLKL